MIKNCYQHPGTPPGFPSWCHFMVLPPLSSTSGDSILSDFFSRSQASGNIWRYCWLQQWGVGGTWWGSVCRRLSHNIQHQKQKSLRMPGWRMLAFHKRYHSVWFLPCLASFAHSTMKSTRRVTCVRGAFVLCAARFSLKPLLLWCVCSCVQVHVTIL